MESQEADIENKWSTHEAPKAEAGGLLVPFLHPQCMSWSFPRDQPGYLYEDTFMGLVKEMQKATTGVHSL